MMLGVSQRQSFSTWQPRAREIVQGLVIALALYTVEPGLIPSTAYVPLAQSGLTHEPGMVLGNHRG